MLIFVVGLCIIPTFAQQDTTNVLKDSIDGWYFTTIDSVGITSIKDQHHSSTCWAYATLGFLESEVLRKKGIRVDFSEMFVVNKTMVDRAKYCVRLYNESCFAPGGSCYDVIYCMSHYGLVPQEAMPEIRYGGGSAEALPVHSELDSVAGDYIKSLLEQQKFSSLWQDGLQAIYDMYLGKCPQDFIYEGKSYTPLSWANSLGLKEDDYVSITSYTHHPFYQRFALEVPDNWRMDMMYNVPIDDLIQIIDNALTCGYTLAWAADISEIGFTRAGVGVVPDMENGINRAQSDMNEWVGMSDDEEREELTKRPLPEKRITQEMRQAAFDNGSTTDDHGMQIFGIAKDQYGKRYYMIKNSWGVTHTDYKGIWYISDAYLRYKTNDILVHKDAIPKEIQKKMGL